MDKPKIFINNINKEINNNKDKYYYNNDYRDVNVVKKIDELFNGEDFVYKNSVEILLKDNTLIKTDVIALKDNELLTLDNKKIKVDDIKNIKKA